MQGKRAVFMMRGRSSPFYDEMAGLAHAHVHSYPMPYEVERGAPRVPRRSWRQRAATALARRFRVGLDPWRLRLLWVGTAEQAAGLVSALPALKELAATMPLSLECLTDAGSPLEQHATPQPGAASAALRVTVGQRAVETVAAALKDCDVVILADAGLFIDALHAGRYVVGGTPADEALAAFASAGEPFTEGLQWFMRHPQRALRRIEEGQAHVTRRHSAAALGRFWMGVLGLSAVDEAAALVQRSRERRANGDGVEAESMLARALELDSGAAEAHHLLGNILQDRGTLDRAISCYRRALRLDPEMAAAHNDLATAYVAKGWRDEAIESYATAIRLDPGSPVAHANLAQLLLKLGRRREALPHVKAAIRWRLAHLVRRTL